MNQDSINRTLVNDFVDDSLVKYNFFGKVLDIGGEKFNSKSKFKDFSYLSLDMNVELLNYSNKVGADIVHDLNYEFPIRDKVYDNVISTNSLYYVDNFELAFSEISRIIKSKGIFILTLPMMMPIDDDRYRFCKTKIIELMNKNDFEILELNSSGFLPSIIYDSLHILIRDAGFTLRKFFRILILFRPFFIFLNNRNFFKSTRVVSNYLIVARKK